MNNIRLEEKHCIIKFLHKVARSDYKILEREINIIHEVATYLELDLDLSEEWVTQWGDKDFATFNELINSNSASLGQIIKWSTDVMNSDHIKHQNEQLMILNLIKESLDNPKYPKAISIPVTELDDTLIQMLHKTP
ncbi:MAG: hypothetical protein B6226_05755 [Candidatus Cloacimonetes bacterium 4572_65]|nr:MAG: hypothetical protein B6226_05755 [Candidatus Cloacimonetes bacterium 4572_65]